MAFPWTEVATIATAAGAGAAWLAASASREAVSRTHRPFVWTNGTTHTPRVVPQGRVRLHNDGPGVALDVRWSVRIMHDPEELPADYDERLEERTHATEPMRGMRSGESSGWWEGVSASGVA